MIRFVSTDHGSLFAELLRTSLHRLSIVAPFVTRDAVIRMRDRLAVGLTPRLITRLNAADLATGVIDAAAIAELMRAGAEIRFADSSLHAKVWITDNTVAVGSVNLTSSGFASNIESMVHAPLDALRGSSPVAWYDGLWDHLTTRGGVRDVAFIEALAEQYAPRRTAGRSQFEEFGAALPAKVTAAEYGEAHGLGSDAWCVLGKRDEGRYGAAEVLGDTYAQYRGAWGFNAGTGAPRMRSGDRIYFVEASTTWRRANDRSLVGRAIVDVPYQPGICDMPAYLEAELSPEGFAQARRWGGYIVWLRNVEVMDGTFDKAASLYDVLPERSGTSRPVKFRVSPEEVTRLDEALDERFVTLGVSRPREPVMWWSKFALHGERYSFAKVAARLSQVTP
jgi:hypothetical protein